VGQEFIIKSQDLEDKINQLLPSQGGFQAGVDLSASTTVIPIVDLTETAEGSLLRADLQNALSLNNITAFAVNNTTSTLITTTGFFRVFGTFNGLSNATSDGAASFSLTDGVTSKKVIEFIAETNSSTKTNTNVLFDFVVFLQAGDSLTATSSRIDCGVTGSTRQLADINGNLTNP
jgi:hypothetical protein